MPLAPGPECTSSTDERDRSGCHKCGHGETTVGEISTTGGGLSKMFDTQNWGSNVVSCTNCSNSELYKGRSSGDIVDVFLG